MIILHKYKKVSNNSYKMTKELTIYVKSTKKYVNNIIYKNQ